jgi:tetratricopeptide (TPR) repeat protein
VVYDSILTKKKKQLHHQIGDAIEELYKGNIDEYYSLLAEHFIEGENFEKGAEYSRFASKKAAKTGSLNDAIAQAEKRVACLGRLPETAEIQKKIIDARATLGMYYNQINNFVLSKEAVEPIVELAFKLDYKRRIAQLYTIIGTHSYAIEEDSPQALKQLKEAIKFAKETNDLISLLMANHWMGHVLADNCEFETALYHLEKALGITVMANVIWGIAAHKSCIARTVYCFKGEIDRGYQGSREGLLLAEESGDAYSKAEAYISLGYSCYGKGFFDEAEEHLLRGSDFCERSNWIALAAMASFCLGETYFYRGEYQKSKEHYAKTIRIFENNRLAPSHANTTRIALARAMVMNNEKDINLELLYSYAPKNKIKLLDGRMRRYIGEILLNIDDQHISDAEDWIKKAIEADKRNGVMFELGRDYAFYAELLKRKGDQPKAKEKLYKAIEIYKECGADGWVKKAEKELATLSK